MENMLNYFCLFLFISLIERGIELGGRVIKVKKMLFFMAMALILLFGIDLQGAGVQVASQVAAGDDHTVGLKSNGTVVAVGDNTYGQCDVDGWDLVKNPGITITSPNGGEAWMTGSKQRITWTSEGHVGDVKIEYKFKKWFPWMFRWTTIIPSTENDGSYDWKVPNTPSTDCLVRISEAADGDPSDVSNRVFTIYSVTPSITVRLPNGGEAWMTDSNQRIIWTSEGHVGDVKIEYKFKRWFLWMFRWTTIIPSTENDGSHDWKVPNTPSTDCLVRISEAADGDPSDVSNSVFTIYSVTPSITVTSPNGNEVWYWGTNQTITWTSEGGVGDVKIELSLDNGTNWTTIIPSTENDGSQPWEVPNMFGSCLVRISEAADGDPSDTSDSPFVIVPPGEYDYYVFDGHDLNGNGSSDISVLLGHHILFMVMSSRVL